MQSVLARFVLVFAVVPGIDAAAEAGPLALDDRPQEPMEALERRLGRQLKDCVMQMLQTTAPVNGELVLNVSVGADGSVRVVNAPGDDELTREGVRYELNGADM